MTNPHPNSGLNALGAASASNSSLEAARVCAVGRVYAGQYLVKGLLGEGGMGEVYLVEHQTLKAELALKVLKPLYRIRDDIVTRFRAESRALWELKHPNFVQVHHAGDDPEIGPYMLMEVLSGKTLAQLLHGMGRVQVERALTIAIEVADTAEAMHTLGIIHRDLKPENIFIARNPSVNVKRLVKLLDLGAAKIAKYGQPATAENRTIGTGRYMSPEHILGRGLSARSDIYALGHIAYEMLAGKHAFGQDHPGQPTHYEYQMWHCNAEPTPLTQAFPDCPEPVWAVIRQAMARAPEHRFESMAAFASALRNVLQQCRVAGVRGGTAKMELPGPATERELDDFLSSPSADGAWSGLAPSGTQSRHGTVTADVSTKKDPISRGMVIAATGGAGKGTQRLDATGPRPELIGHLVTEVGPIPGHRYALARGTYAVGRDVAVDLYLNDPSLSARHAKIVVHPTGIIELSDEGSTNGTFVNEKPITFAVLKNGDAVRFGTVRLRISYVDASRLSFAPDGTVRVESAHDFAPATAHSSGVLAAQAASPAGTFGTPADSRRPQTLASPGLASPGLGSSALIPPNSAISQPLGSAMPAAYAPTEARPVVAHVPTVPMSPVAAPAYLLSPETSTGVATPPAARSGQSTLIAVILGCSVGLLVVTLVYWLLHSGKL